MQEWKTENQQKLDWVKIIYKNEFTAIHKSRISATDQFYSFSPSLAIYLFRTALLHLPRCVNVLVLVLERMSESECVWCVLFYARHDNERVLHS